MNGKELFELLNDIDDDIVKEVSKDMLFRTYPQEGISIHADHSPKKIWRTVMASVACTAAVMAGMFVLILNIAKIRTDSTSASSVGSSGQNSAYADASEYSSAVENEQTDNAVQFEGHGFDDKAFRIMTLGFTVNGDQIYAQGPKNTRIDGKSGEVSVLCTKDGCDHDINSPGCTANMLMQSWISSPDGIYYCSDNNFCLYDGKTHTVILQNDFYTDYEEEFYSDSKCSISTVYRDGLFYLVGATYYFTYDPSSGEKSEPVVIADTAMWTLAVGEGNVYYITDTDEAYIYNIASGERKKLGGNITTLDFVNGVLYYTQYENGVPMLYAADKDGGNAKKILEDCWVNFAVTEDCIYYQNYIDPEYSIYVCGLDGSDPRKLTFSNNSDGKEYSVGLAFIVTSSTSDKVFIIDRTKVFSFDKGSEKGEFIHWAYGIAPTVGYIPK